ncbi:unnamed protein product [Calicophoron daubneyi]|uniref:D domain-containing protein n=1 Tax=Calicophoron daubneyi TaxID=300641 RepID=A0AAV2TLM3_CALDB
MSVTMEELLSRLEQWNPPDQVEFVTSAIAQMSAGQQREIKQFLDSLLQRDFISLLYTRSYQNIAEEILSFLDADSLAAAESVCSIWRDVILQGRLWQRLIQYRAKQDCMWRQVLFRLDLVRYFHWSSYDPVWLEYQNEMVSVAETVGVGSFHSPICKKSDSAISSSSVDYKQEHSSVYRCLYFHLAQLTNFDDRMILSASSDTTVRSWSIATGESLCTLRHHREGVLHLRFMADTLVTCSRDNTVAVLRIISPSDIRFLCSLTGHKASVNVVDFDSKYILSGGGDRTIRVWSMTTLTLASTLVGHRRGVDCLHYHGQLAVSGSSDLTVRIWDVESSQCLRILEGHKELVRCLRFNETHIVSGAYDGILSAATSLSALFILGL